MSLLQYKDGVTGPTHGTCYSYRPSKSDGIFTKSSILLHLLFFLAKEGICGMAYWGRGVICVIQWKGKVVPIGDQILDLGMLSTLSNGLTQQVR